MAISIEKLPRVRLANLPTPLEEMPRLSKILEGPKIWIKRDDCTGLAFGGSKVRALEFTMADAIDKGADTIITIGSFQSNHARLTAAASRKLGLRAVLLLRGEKPKKYEGNLLLDHILGADIRFVKEKWRELPNTVKKIAKELKDEGRIPYILPAGGSSPIGTIGYIDIVTELQTQAKNIGLEIDYVVHATGSGGTQAGLTVGNRMLNTNMKVIGIINTGIIDIITAGIKKRLIHKTLKIANNVCKILNMDITLETKDLSLIYNYTEEKHIINAIMLVAQTEGILLDPNYSGKAMATLIDMVKEKKFDKEDNLVFIHTGGTPALFVNSPTRPLPLPDSFINLQKKIGAIISLRMIRKSLISR